MIILYHYNANAQVDSNTLESIVNQTGFSDVVAQIHVGGVPVYIYGGDANSIYVANSGSDSVNVIDTTIRVFDPPVWYCC